MLTRELDCRSVRTLDRLVDWAIAAFAMQVDVEDLPRRMIPGLVGEREVPDMNHFTDLLYRHLAAQGVSYDIGLVHPEAMSRWVAAVLDGPQGWRQSFGSGLPRDHGVAVSFAARP